MFEVEKKQKAKSLSLRFTEKEYNFIIEQAKSKNLTITNYFKYVLNKEFAAINDTVSEPSLSDDFLNKLNELMSMYYNEKK